MAKKTITVLTDDLDGTEAVETVSFAFDGTSYQIDLSSDNVAKLRNVLLPYIAVAQKTGGRTRSSGGQRRGRVSSGGPNTAEIRAWAADNGYEVSSRGRVPAEVRAAYEASHRG